MRGMAEFGEAVTRLAADAVRTRLSGGEVEAAALLREDDPKELREPGATFVTLERGGVLRGCIGSLEARRALYEDVVRNALRAMEDPRMPPVEAEEWPVLTVKVSVLTAPEPVDAAGPRELLAALRPGVDGLILTDGKRRATFLPSVWRKLDTPQRFLAALLRKGGWNTWPEGGLTVRRYESHEYTSNPPPGGRT